MAGAPLQRLPDNPLPPRARLGRFAAFNTRTPATSSPLHQENIPSTPSCEWCPLLPYCRWLCTGTPINTDISDLLGQFCVLGMSPFNHNNYFNTHVRPAFGPHAFG
jgi:hypothetical protein